jgi:hypothetical protein
MLQAFLASQPIGRPGEAGDIAHAVRYLLGPESAWVTGQLFTVDGGHTLRAFVNYADLIDIPDVRAAIAGGWPPDGWAPSGSAPGSSAPGSSAPLASRADEGAR